MKNTVIKQISAIALTGALLMPVISLAQTPSVSMTVTSPTAVSGGSPQLLLRYDSANHESLLMANFALTINGGSSDTKIYQSGFNIQITKDGAPLNTTINSTQKFASSTSFVTGTDMGGVYFIVPAYTGGTISVTETVNPQQLYAGQYSFSLNGAYGAGGYIPVVAIQTNSVTIVGESVSQASANIVGSPTTIVGYDNANRESSLMGMFEVNVTAGNSDLKIYKSGFGIQTIYNNNPYTGSNVSSQRIISSSTAPQNLDMYGNTYYTIPAGTSYPIYVTEIMNPQQLYSGQYAFSLKNIYAVGNTISVPTNQTNSVTVVGESTQGLQSNVSVTTNPLLSLTYDSTNHESALVGTFNYTVMAGANPLNILKAATVWVKNAQGAYQNLNYIFQTASSSVPLQTQMVNGINYSYYAIPANQSATFQLSVTVNPQQMYAGQYTMSVINLTSMDFSRYQISTISVPQNQTNAVTIVGETNSGNSGSVNVSVDSISRPIFRLQYSPDRHASSLVAHFRVMVTASTQGVWLISQPSYGVLLQNRKDNINVNVNSPVIQFTSSTSSVVADGSGNYFLATGTPEIFDVTATYNPQKLFAGIYRAVLHDLMVINPTNSQSYIALQVLPPVSTNYAYVMGETNPYITSITNPVYPRQLVVIRGNHFVNTGWRALNNITIGNNTIVRPSWGNTITFTPSRYNITPGIYPVVISNRFGTSSPVYLQIKDLRPIDPGQGNQNGSTTNISSGNVQNSANGSNTVTRANSKSQKISEIANALSALQALLNQLIGK